MNTKNITDIVIEDIDMNDAPDFADANIVYGTYEGKSLTSDELCELNNNSDFLYEQIINNIY